MAAGAPIPYDPNNYDRIVQNRKTGKYSLQYKKWYGAWKFRMVQSNSCGYEPEYTDTFDILEFDDLENAKKELKKFQDKRREVKYGKSYRVIPT